jgi:hypothetical protein
MTNPISSRPEDFLATDVQKQICDEVLTRSFACNWDDVPSAAEESTTGSVVPGTAVSTLPPVSALSTLGTGAPDLPGATPGPAFVQAFDRESTPRTMRDVKMLETVPEEDEGDGERQGKGIVEDMALLTDCHPEHDLHTNQRFFNLTDMPIPPASGFSGGPLDMAAGFAYGRMGQRV